MKIRRKESNEGTKKDWELHVYKDYRESVNARKKERKINYNHLQSTISKSQPTWQNAIHHILQHLLLILNQITRAPPQLDCSFSLLGRMQQFVLVFQQLYPKIHSLFFVQINYKNHIFLPHFSPLLISPIGVSDSSFFILFPIASEEKPYETLDLYISNTPLNEHHYLQLS